MPDDTLSSRSEYDWRAAYPQDPKRSSILRRKYTNRELVYELYREQSGYPALIHTILFIELDQPIDRADFLDRLCHAWAKVRVKYPIIGARSFKTGTEKDPLSHHVEVDTQTDPEMYLQWARDKTLTVEYQGDNITLDRLDKTCQTPNLPTKDGDYHLVEAILPRKQSFTSVGLGVWLDHAFLDGVSSRVLLSDLRRFLARPHNRDDDMTPRLNNFTSSLLDPKWGSPTTQIDPEFLAKNAANANDLVHTHAPREQHDNNGSIKGTFKSVHPYEKLTAEETKAMTSYCHKYNISVSAFAVSALLVRLILDRHETLPLPLETIFASNVAADARPVLLDPRAVGMHIHLDMYQVPLGKILAGRTRKLIERDYIDIVHQVALAASEHYLRIRTEEARIKGVLTNEANLAAILPAVASGKMVDSLSKRIVRFYTDTIISAPSLETDFICDNDGIGSTIRDWYLVLAVNVNAISARSWCFQGQTGISLNVVESFMGEEEASSIVKAWKRDLIEVSSAMK